MLFPKLAELNQSKKKIHITNQIRLSFLKKHRFLALRMDDINFGRKMSFDPPFEK